MRLVSFFGIFVLILVAWAFSEDRRRFPWRVVAWGLGLQFAFAFLVLRWEPGRAAFDTLNGVFNALLAFSQEGARFVFGPLAVAPGGAGSLGFFFAFQILTTIIFFSALLSILYYLGVMQKVVLLFARVMSRTMGVSGAESLSNAANIFVGQTEAPLVVRPYIEKMTRSELASVMVGGFANTAGGVLGAYILMLAGYFPNIAAHLISASVLSAPAAFIFAKILVPERETPLTRGEVTMEVEVEDANVIDAAANGTTVGWQLAINVGAMLLAFVALVALVNAGFNWMGGFFHDAFGAATFVAMAVSAAAVLFYVDRRGTPGDGVLWGTLAALGLAVLVTRRVDPPTAAIVARVGGAAWLALLLVSARRRSFGAYGWGSLLAVAVAAWAAFALWGPLDPARPLTLQLVLGWVHWPVALIMGVPPADCLTVGRFLGEKLILTEFTAYLNLSEHLAAAGRGEVPALDPRSLFILSYALCGFANVASIGIQIGGLVPLAPSRRHEIARLGVKTMIGGALATFMIACVAGLFYSGRSMIG